MVTTNTICNNCIHNKVCSIKDEVVKVKNDAMEIFGDTMNECIEISVRCKEYNQSKQIFR